MPDGHVHRERHGPQHQHRHHDGEDLDEAHQHERCRRQGGEHRQAGNDLVLGEDRIEIDFVARVSEVIDLPCLERTREERVPEPEEQRCDAPAPERAFVYHIQKYSRFPTSWMPAPKRYDVRRPQVSATMLVGISNSTSPSV
jgi:hypothetical protein